MIAVSALLGLFLYAVAAEPNIVYIILDDLGFTDVEYNNDYEGNLNSNTRFETKLFDEWALSGITLNQHYTEPMCSASRSALMTGRYAWRSGMDGLSADNSLTASNTSYPLYTEFLKEAGYKTLFTGKWHLGMASTTMAPYNRGFDMALYHQLGYVDYYTKQICRPWSVRFDPFTTDVFANLSQSVRELNPVSNAAVQPAWCAYDFRDEKGQTVKDETTFSELMYMDKILKFIDANKDEKMYIHYATDIPHFPMEVPPRKDFKNNDIDYSACDAVTDTVSFATNLGGNNGPQPQNSPNRRMFCELMVFGQRMIEHIVDKLKEVGVYNNTIIAVIGDNGPQFAVNGFNPGYGQTLPLRGTKGSTFEGGIRTPGFLFGGYLDNMSSGALSGCEYDEMFYIADWYASILGMANIDNISADIDSINVWEDIKSTCLSNGETDFRRTEMVQMRKFPNSGFYYATAVRNGSYKLVVNGTRSAANRNVYRWFGLWLDVVATNPLENPIDAGYDLLSNDSMLRSKCFDQMDESEQNDSSNFEPSEFMLFDLSNDPIEACNLYDAMPDIANALMQRLDELSAKYDGGGLTPPLPIAFSVAADEWQCDLNCYYPNGSYNANDCNGISLITPWLELNLSSSITWTDAYETMMDEAGKCTQLPSMNPTVGGTLAPTAVVVETTEEVDGDSADSAYPLVANAFMIVLFCFVFMW